MVSADAFGAARDPVAVLSTVRAGYGAVAPLEFDETGSGSGLLILGYDLAVTVLNDPGNLFTADSGVWEQMVAPGGRCPMLPATAFAPSAARGESAVAHRHGYRVAIAGVDEHAVRAETARAARALIGRFCADGHADLLGQYAIPLVTHVMDGVLGFTPEVGRDVAAAAAEVRAATDLAAASAGIERALAAIGAVVAARRTHPARDVISALLADTQAAWSDVDVAAIVARMHLMGTVPTWKVIASGLLRLIADTGEDADDIDVIGGSVTVASALEEVLATDPPVAAVTRWTAQHQLFEGEAVGRGIPVVVSIQAADTDPAVTGSSAHGEHLPRSIGGRWHLAWGLGSRGCPASSLARIIAETALEQILDTIHDVELATETSELLWRGNGFDRELVALPVTFPPVTPV
ncbi:cytochrome P450 [Nocardia puris]|uniref:cytochrome P450 n=1 Tax=Nocardia puris TaxID=208602 RepID=UPI001893407B|nr:cytochrome P450 [Nocardia puris]MBF6215898.1 cytochrome P450 [Nocardia puris]